MSKSPVRLLIADPPETWVRTDDLSRSPESQIRAERDPRLVAEYAEAMLEGAKFPPVVIFQDSDGWKYLADGHHRVDAAALAALKDPRRKAEVLADIRPGDFHDALRWAMQANRLHGKRMTEADYKRAIDIAIQHNLLTSAHAKDVVPEVVELVGCSVRTAQENTVSHRKAMIEKRDRLIIAMHREGRTQEAIGDALEVAQPTVAKIVKVFITKRDTAFCDKPKRPTPPIVEWLEESAEVEPQPQAPKADAPPAFTIDLAPYLPLLDRLRPWDEGGDDMESGPVGRLADVMDDAPGTEPDPYSQVILGRMANDLTAFLEVTEADVALLHDTPFRPSDAQALINTIVVALDYFDELKNYLTGRVS